MYVLHSKLAPLYCQILVLSIIFWHGPDPPVPVIYLYAERIPWLKIWGLCKLFVCVLVGFAVKEVSLEKNLLYAC